MPCLAGHRLFCLLPTVYCDEVALIRDFELLWGGVGLLHEDILAFFHKLFSLFGKLVVFFFLDDFFQVLHRCVYISFSLDAELSNVKVRTT